MTRSYVTTLDGKERTVEVEQLDGDRYRVTVDGVSTEVDALAVEPATLSLREKTRVREVEIERINNSAAVRVMVGGEVFTLDLLDERRRRLAAARGTFKTSGPQTVLAPMPGKIVRVLVKAGTAVTEGQGLIVVEAMKMENELRAAHAGKVKEIFVKEGQAIEGGAKLMLVES